MSLWLKSAENQDENENSDSSDEDYVPGDAPDVSEEEDDGDDEAALDYNEGNDEQSSANKPRAKRKQPRKRGVAESRGTFFFVSDSEDAREAEAKRLKTEAEQEKLRADKLFADFMSDVGRPRDRVKQQVSVSPADSDPVTSTGVSSRLTASDSTSSVKPPVTASSPPSPTVPPSVNNTAARSDVNSCSPHPASGDIRANIKLASSSVAEVKPAPGAPRRRGGALSALVGSINKPAKMNVLQRSSLDWDRFKDDTGAHEELQQHVRSKDSYLEKQDFLMRTDQRQFEQEKAMRDRHRTPRV